MNSLSIRIQEEKDPNRFELLLQELNGLIARKKGRFPRSGGVTIAMSQGPTRPWKRLSGTAGKVVKNVIPNEPDRVEIEVAEADNLFREIRIENTFTSIDGHLVSLKQGAHVDVTLEADVQDTMR